MKNNTLIYDNMSNLKITDATLDNGYASMVHENGIYYVTHIMGHELDDPFMIGKLPTNYSKKGYDYKHHFVVNVDINPHLPQWFKHHNFDADVICIVTVSKATYGYNNMKHESSLSFDDDSHIQFVIEKDEAITYYEISHRYVYSHIDERYVPLDNAYQSDWKGCTFLSDLD